MKAQNSSRSCFAGVFVSGVLICLFTFIVVTGNSGYAQEKSSPIIGGKEKIEIISDSLTVEHASRYAEFTGNVKVTQGDAEIKADGIKIYYKEGVGQDLKPAEGEESIEKIVATGNVKIKYQNRVAVTDEAVYITKTRVLMLNGDNSKVTSGNDSVSGAKITVHTDSNRIMIESSKAKRVEAVFYPGGKAQ
jgi:lipopolysaccharide export system protein LptA